ncbi:hypothetical protein EW146_g2933 [Bondarzewia mesenterica]|uniref:ENTH domain-containing protein n=1 Tax=Bondarzewia mesenterica TaxID=1095465 RepID=A0A4S4LZN7_9AGAM|nr:hypothetical protein EW146_g2933 [Bondarzewia mesenterica]
MNALTRSQAHPAEVKSESVGKTVEVEVDGSHDAPAKYAFVSLTEDEVSTRLDALAHPRRKVFDAARGRKADSVTFQPCQAYSSQDRYVVKELEVHGKKWTFTGVFDGHLGDATVEHTAYHLPIIVTEFLHKVITGPFTPAPAFEVISDILSRAITSFDDAIAGDVLELFPGGIDSLPERSNEEIRSVVNDYYDGGQNYHKAKLCMYGTTALVALVDPDYQHLWVANLGDSEAVLVSPTASGQWTFEILNDIHNGENDSEIERVMRDHPGESECVLDGRVLGAIAPFRCIGDAPFKQPALFTRRILYNLYPGIPDSSPWDNFLNRNLTPPYISSHPEVVHRPLSRPHGLTNGQGRKTPSSFLILATDGLTALYDGFEREEMARECTRHIGAALSAAASRGTGEVDGQNLALELLRQALGGDDLIKVSQMLTLDMERPWMDDTTIVVQALTRACALPALVIDIDTLAPRLDLVVIPVLPTHPPLFTPNLFPKLGLVRRPAGVWIEPIQNSEELRQRLMALAHASKSALRAAKNITHGYSDTEAKVRATTSNESLPPNGQQMYEISVLSYNQLDFVEIMEILDKRLNDKGKYWRHVYKALVLVDYLLHSGSPAVASYFRHNLYIIKTLCEFQHIDDDGRDVGKDVRIRARDITRLLSDDIRLAEERRRRRQMHDRMLGRPSREGRGEGDDSEDMRRALEASRRGKDNKGKTNEEKDMERALKLSVEEEKERKRRLAEKGMEDALFDDSQQIDSNSLIDTSISNSPAQQLQPQYTQLQPQFTQLQPQYTQLQPQFTQLQPQLTQLQPQYTQLQPQYTQFALQPQYTQMQIQPQHTVQPQYTAYDPYSQQAQYEALLQQQQSQVAPRALMPQLTAFGSNNPFAPPSSPVTSHATAVSTPGLTYRASTSSSNASTRPPVTPDTIAIGAREENARLAELFSARTGSTDEGVDTFGNVGALRFAGAAYDELGRQKTGQVGNQRTGQSTDPFA